MAHALGALAPALPLLLAPATSIHDDFGKGRAKGDGRETARKVAERQGEKNR